VVEHRERELGLDPLVEERNDGAAADRLPAAIADSALPHVTRQFCCNDLANDRSARLVERVTAAKRGAGDGAPTGVQLDADGDVLRLLQADVRLVRVGARLALGPVELDLGGKHRNVDRTGGRFERQRRRVIRAEERDRK
jgi:hypothetical protein